MKKSLFFSFCFFFILNNSNAQFPSAMPADAASFYDNSMPVLRPQVKNIILQTAKAMQHHKANADSLLQALRINSILKSKSNNDIEGIIVLIMVQASKDADDDLKKAVLEISHNSEQKKESNNENKKEAHEEINDVQNLQLQMIMNRKSNMAEEVGYTMKKISGSQQNIINNLK